MSNPNHKPVRVRIAPSPTGYLHVGGVRSFLFNWLYARHTGGTYIMRLEDTDRTRYVPDALEQISASLGALGLTPDEGPLHRGPSEPYIQSERLDLYRQHADILLESGSLYPCWCSPERLTQLREEAQKTNVAFKYDRYCLDHKRSLDEPHVLRFYIPVEPTVIGWNDEARGKLEFKTSELDDFVAMKSDGYPTYHFANVVDDHLMNISHVMRADEWLPSTPKHLLLFAAFGWDAPIYVHLPAILGPDGKKKLSKRDGAVAVQDYIAEGYLPEALLSFLATLGWNDGTTQEVYTREELIRAFSLDRIQKSPAKFDKERLTWMNGLLIRQMPQQALLKRSEGFWPSGATEYEESYRLAVLGLVQERLKYLAELPELTDFFFSAPEVDSAVLTKTYGDETASHLGRLCDIVNTTNWTHEAIETALRNYVTEHDLKASQLFGLIRVAITGKTAAPGLFETMLVLGKDATLERLNMAKAQITV